MNTKYEVRGDVKYSYSSDWINQLEEKKHWEFYWYQQKVMEGLLDSDKDTVLEIGTGSGFAANYMRSKGVSIITFDIDPDKKPDIVGNIVDYKFQEKFDCLMAFEVLEHIPYAEFEKIIKKIPQLITKYAFISLPRNLISLFQGYIKVPILPPLQWDLRLKRRKITVENHHWELDHDHSVEFVENFFIDNDLKIEKKLSHDRINFYALKLVNGDEG